jgi:16S rRNA (cytidine1402-2'-O)-methyltransferase
MPERQACIARELTKLHEEVRRGTLSVLAGEETTARGEFTIVVAGLEGEEPDEIDVDSLVLTLLGSGASPRTVAEEVSTLSGKPKREVYARVLELRRRDDAG